MLQAAARTHGHNVRVVYANIRFAVRISEEVYQAISYGPTSDLVGERIFARAAYGSTPLGGMNSRDTEYFKSLGTRWKSRLSLADLQAAEAETTAWVDDFVAELIAYDPDVIGVSTTFEQTAAALAILSCMKAKAPWITTLLGGGNCEGKMAQGILTIGSCVDHIFAGESETTFPRLLDDLETGRSWPRIIAGSPCVDLDSLPCPKYEEYYAELQSRMPNSSLISNGLLWLPYETSRGCWWGAKRKCTFCGVNGENIDYRKKSCEVVISELRSLLDTHPTRNVCMVDNIMPHDYFRNTLPTFARELPNLHVFYEQKANLTLEQVEQLKRAGIAVIQPGIEALSSGLLRLMRKGVSASQNLALLRYCRALDVTANWNLLFGFPGDLARWYQETEEFVPLLSHLPPPTGLFHIIIDRFSPYHDEPGRFGLSNLQPLPAYAALLPASADVGRIAYHFVGDYPSESHDGLVVEGLRRAISEWQESWRSGPPPVLEVSRISDDTFLLADTRRRSPFSRGEGEFSFVSRDRAQLALAGTRDERAPELGWAVARGIVIKVDGSWVPLAVADPTLMREMMANRNRPMDRI